MSAIPLFLVAIWVRTPAIPRTGGSAARNDTERATAAEAAVRALERSLSEALQHLDERAAGALDAPIEVPAAFSFLDRRAPQRDGESVVLFDHDRPLAWAGTIRIDPDSVVSPVSASFSPFYVTLNVVKTRGDRRAVASVVLHAVAPADRLTESLDSRVAPVQGVASYEFAAPRDPRGGPIVLSYRGQPVLRALPRLADPDEVRFRSSARLRARGTIALVILVLAFLVYAWRDRRSLSERLFALVVALGVTALVPWNSFSNTSRVFDPAYYFSKLAGPLTANAAALSISSVLVLIGVYAVIRAHPDARWPRLYAGIGAVVTLGVGIPFASNIVRGIGQPPWGSTPGLWLSWEVPLFVFLFAVLLATYWLLRMAFGKPGSVSFRAGVAIASISAIVALGGLWSTTLRQRMQLAEEDVAALGHVDDYVVLLARRFATDLAQSAPPMTRAALLEAYAASDLAAAEYPATLAAWDNNATETAEFAVSDAQADSDVILKTVREAVATSQTVTRSILGPTGVQILSAVKHPSGGVTSVLVFPRTRLLAANPYAALLGLTSQSGGDPPYAVGLTDVSPAVAADTAKVTWHRMGDELHGDRLISTSEGTKRAHIKIDLRSVWARAERGLLVLLLDLLVAGFFWLLGALPEKGFARWVRVRAGHWIYTYHARLTLALFAFFVVPAVAFAVWSYQRLRGDDLQTKEVLVQETLHAVGAANEYDQLPAAERRFETPLFLYSNGFLTRTSDSLLDALAPAGRPLPPEVQLRLASAGEVTAASEEKLGPAKVLFGYSAALG
ncbi:MAG TPA: hypothetical protein VIM36_13800, partial [Gemmatimonadaceae bacterium]